LADADAGVRFIYVYYFSCSEQSINSIVSTIDILSMVHGIINNITIGACALPIPTTVRM
jgi:hypothetical protein